MDIGHHAFDHAQLLRVLLAEVGALRLDDAKETGDHGGNAAEVAGTMRAFEAFREPARDFDPISEAGRIHLLDRRNEGGVYSLGLE